jgi:indolepyruvate ferredoxin oxidoreductase
VEIEANQKAFIMGCRFAIWPEKVLALLEPSDHGLQKTLPAESMDLDELVDDRASRLLAYQSTSFAEAYRHKVDVIRQLDPQALSAGSISHVVATQLYRLMAIKDEYEVARLFSNDAFRAQLDAQFEPGYRLQFHLAPPILSRIDHATGRSRKRAFGGWMMIVFKVLAVLRRLRNTPLDVFALTAERRSARSDLEHYLNDLDLIQGHLYTDNQDDALRLARLPEKLRGYGVVRDRARAALKPERDALRQKLASKDPAPLLRVWPAESAHP